MKLKYEKKVAGGLGTSKATTINTFRQVRTERGSKRFYRNATRDET